MDAAAQETPNVHVAAGLGASLITSRADEVERPWGIGVGTLLHLEAEKRVFGGLFIGASTRYQYTQWVGCGSCGAPPSSHMPQALVTFAYEFSSLRTSQGPRIGLGAFWNHTITQLTGTAERERTVFYGPVFNAGYYVFAKRFGVFAGGELQLLYPVRRGGNDDMFAVLGVAGFSFGSALFAH